VLWFDQLGYLEVLLTNWSGTVAMFLIGFVAMFIPVWLATNLAYRFRPVYAKLSNELDRYRQIIDPIRKVAMLGVPALLALFAGLGTAGTWPQFLLWMNREPFGRVDPEFGLDVGFYVFELPVFNSVISFASTVLAPVCRSHRSHWFSLRSDFSQRSRIAYFSHHADPAGRRRGAVLPRAGDKPLVAAVRHPGFSQRWILVLWSRVFTEVSATIPARAIMAGIAILVALLFLITAIIGRWRLAVIGTALYIVSGLVLGLGYPAIIQRFQVDPQRPDVGGGVHRTKH